MSGLLSVIRKKSLGYSFTYICIPVGERKYTCMHWCVFACVCTYRASLGVHKCPCIPTCLGSEQWWETCSSQLAFIIPDVVGRWRSFSCSLVFFINTGHNPFDLRFSVLASRRSLRIFFLWRFLRSTADPSSLVFTSSWLALRLFVAFNHHKGEKDGPKGLTLLPFLSLLPTAE